MPGHNWVAISGSAGGDPGGARELGPLPSPTPVTFELELALPNAEQAQAFENGLTVPGSPSFHHFLNLTQFDAAYGPSPEEERALFDYLAGYGLRVPARGGPFLYTLTAPAEAVEQAFHLQLVDFASASGVAEFAPTSSPSLPAALAPLVGSIAGLDQFDQPVPSGLSAPGGPAVTVITPTVMRGFYNATPLLSEGDRGNYYAIGLAEMCDPLEPKTSTFTSDLNAFDSLYGLPAANVTYLDTGATSCTQGYPGWGEETDLDMQWAHVMAPGATLYVCLDNSDPDSCDQMFVANQSADNLEFGSNSFGWITSDHSVWQAADAAGMTLVSAAGDKCAGVVYPSEEPDGVGVGGTAITPNGDAFGSETAWSCTGSGNSKEGTGGGCDTSDAPPSYQTTMPGYPGPCTTSDRGVPDVGMDASQNSPVDIIYAGTTTEVEGTSLASPMWAATLDLIYQYAAAGGFAAPTLYSLAESANYDLLFHDITTGNNGYPATAGWDPDTGIGSPDIAPLAAAWPKGGGTGGTDTVTFSVSPAGDGALVFNGATYYNGNSVSVPAGNYTYSAVLQPWSDFTGWSASGSVSLAGGTGKVWVQGRGSLTLTLAPRAVVSFSASPAGCLSSLSFNGTAAPASGTYPLGTTYVAVAGACASGGSFSSWTGAGGVAASSPSSATTTVTLTSNGSLVATYATSSTYAVAIQLVAPGDGAVVLQGQDYYDGGIAVLAAGTHAIGASANAWATFGAWSTSGSVTIGSGQLTVSGAGTVTATFSALDEIGFTLNETACAPVYFNGPQAEGSGGGTTATVPSGTYPLRADACAGHSFVAWAFTGGVVASPSTSNATQLQVTGNGTVEGLFDPVSVPTYGVAITIHPSTCPSLTLDGALYASGATAELGAGTYSVSAASCTGYEPTVTFSGTGGVSVNAGGTEVTVASGGSLSAVYSPVPVQGITASLSGPATASIGTSVAFTVSFTGGTAPYTLTWMWGDGSEAFVVSGVEGTSSTATHTYTLGGDRTVTVFVNDSASDSKSASAAITITSVSSVGGSSSGSSGNGGLSSSDWVLLAAGVAAAAAAFALAAVLLRRRSRGQGPGEGSPYPEGPTGYPGSGEQGGAGEVGEPR